MKINKKDFVRAKRHLKLSPGKVVKILREWQNLTQEDFVKMTGMTQSNISSIESGASNIGRDRAIILAKALKVHPAVILFPDFDSTSLKQAVNF